MHIRINKLLSSTRWSIGYILFIPVIVCGYVIWNGIERVNEFEKSHSRIAESTTLIVANEISKQIKSQHRLLRVFSNNEAELIYRLAHSPDNTNLKQQLQNKIAESFPNYFTVSIANNSGIPVLDDFDSMIGELCLEDLKQNANGYNQPVRIHPDPRAYHIDIVVPWTHKNTEDDDAKLTTGLLFVSFKPDFLARLLAISSPPQHELMLINNKIKNLIEITEKGPRIVLKRDDFRLTSDELKRQLYSTPVENTSWYLADFYEPLLFSHYRNNTIIFSVVIIIIFIIGSITMVYLLLRSESLRIETDRTKEEMFSLFNHDLRAPLTSIFGFLEMFTTTKICEKKPERCSELAVRAFDNAETMLGIVDDILDIQKMESGGMKFEFSETDIVALLKDTIDANYQYANLYNVKLKMITELDVAYITCDGRRIKQALTNLISNAVKYSPEDENVVLQIRKKINFIKISVTDKGPGIDAEFQKIMFDKFSQSKSKLTRRVGGTGLGLAIVKQIIEKHRGEISVESEEDKGTTFTILLPLN